MTVLSHDYWATRLGANPAILNETIIVNGQALTIVGVAPRGFASTTLGSEPRVFVPLTMRAQMSPGWNGFDNRQSYWAYLFGRLKPGVSIEQARAGINSVYQPIITDVEAKIYLQKGDYAKVIPPWEIALRLTDKFKYLSENSVQELIYYLAQIYYQEASTSKVRSAQKEGFAKATSYLERWIANSKKPPGDVRPLGSILIAGLLPTYR